MRVLQVLHTDERGGIATLASMIADGLKEHGFLVDTVFLYPDPNLGSAAKVFSAFTAAKDLLSRDYDALIAYQATASLLCGFMGSLKGCRYRIVHQTAVPSETAWPLRLADKIFGMLGFYTANVVNTAFTRHEFAGYPERYRRSLVLIEHGIKRCVPSKSRDETRRQFSLPLDSKLILNVGRMTHQKNQSVIIEALSNVKDAELVIAGQGPCESEYLDLARQIGVSDRVHLLGPVSPQDVCNLYQACDVFAFPSVWETFGLAAAEAAMSTIPLAISDIAVLREVLRSENSPAIFVPPNDVKEWSGALAALSLSPPDLTQRMDFADEIGARYGVNKMIDGYLKLLRAKSGL